MSINRNKKMKLRNIVLKYTKSLRFFLRKILSPKFRRRLNKWLVKTDPKIEINLMREFIDSFIKEKLMVDVGAHFGESFEYFYRNGWIIHAFEPDPKNRAIIKNDFPKLYIDPRAISDKEEKKVSFYSSAISTGISSLTPFDESHKESVKVETVSIGTFAKEKKIDKIGFLKSDVEGHDLFVLRSIPFESLRPELIMCEYDDKKTIPLGYDVYDIANFLHKENKYFVLISEWYSIIEYGTNHKWRRFSRYPCKIGKKSNWGNIIAVETEGNYKKLCQIADRYNDF